MNVNLDLSAPFNHPIFGMPLRTLFLAFVCTFAPWAIPLCMPISGARPPYAQMIMWFFVKMADRGHKITINIKD